MIYQLKIKLLDVKKPSVWRRVLVDADITFDDLHHVIQTAMGWDNYHLYQFGYKAYDRDFTIGVPQPNDWDPPRFNARKTVVSKYLNDQHPKMKYIYDFGDDWIHDITLEKTLEPSEVSDRLPVCMAGKGACPPEDCGGPWGYEELKELLTKKDPDEEEKGRLEWYGMDDGFDPKQIDIDFINSLLEELRFKKTKKRKKDPAKQEERIALLRTLTTGFCRAHLKKLSSAKECDELIMALADCDELNLANGDPEIWAAAIVLTADEMFPDFSHSDDYLENEEVCKFFNVKWSSVKRRFDQIMEAEWDIEDEFDYDDDYDDEEFEGDYDDPVYPPFPDPDRIIDAEIGALKKEIQEQIEAGEIKNVDDIISFIKKRIK